MPNIVHDEPLMEASGERTESTESPATSRANPFANPPSTPASPNITWVAPPIDSSSQGAHDSDNDASLTLAIAALLTLLAGGALAVGAVGWADINPFPIIAVGIFVFFAGLFARSQFGGGKRLLLVGPLLLPVVAVAATAAPYLDDGVGDRSYQPASFEDVKSDYRFGIGNLDVDLRSVEFPPGEHLINIEHGIGAARVYLPADVSSVVSGDVAIGKLDLLGQSDDGVNTTIDAETGEDVGPGGATIVLEFDTSIGYGLVEID